jgi:hypothetical protein
MPRAGAAACACLTIGSVFGLFGLTSTSRLHRLGMGQLGNSGHRTYGYDYVRKTRDAPATLVINEEQAAIVRSIFEMFARRQVRSRDDLSLSRGAECSDVHRTPFLGQ